MCMMADIGYDPNLRTVGVSLCAACVHDHVAVQDTRGPFPARRRNAAAVHRWDPSGERSCSPIFLLKEA